MPGPVIIANTYRVTLLWEKFGNVAPRNVINLESHAIGAGEAQVGATFWNHATSNMFGVMHSSQVLHKVLVEKYDGTTAGQFVTGGPIEGASTSQPIPAAAMVISLRTNTRGPRGRGRVYIGPVCEGNQDSGVIDATSAGNIQTAWETFLSGVKADLFFPCTLVVASRIHSDQHEVISLSAEQNMGTQRRRQGQVRG